MIFLNGNTEILLQGSDLKYELTNGNITPSLPQQLKTCDDQTQFAAAVKNQVMTRACCMLLETQSFQKQKLLKCVEFFFDNLSFVKQCYMYAF